MALRDMLCTQLRHISVVFQSDWLVLFVKLADVLASDPNKPVMFNLSVVSCAADCRSKGYGFVSFRTQDAAEKGIAVMNGKLVGHRYPLLPDSPTAQSSLLCCVFSAALLALLGL